MRITTKNPHHPKYNDCKHNQTNKPELVDSGTNQQHAANYQEDGESITNTRRASDTETFIIINNLLLDSWWLWSLRLNIWWCC
jgi:hypothetical protein